MKSDRSKRLKGNPDLIECVFWEKKEKKKKKHYALLCLGCR